MGQQVGPADATISERSVATLARTAIARGLNALAANDLQVALRWLERAHRIVPHDPSAALTLASACLTHDPAKAASLFQSVTAKHDVRQAWLGLAAARLQLTGPQDAAQPLAVALSRHAFGPDAMALANTIGLGPNGSGWCAVRSDGRLEIHHRVAGKIHVALDGKRIAGTKLPATWERSRTIDIQIGETPLLGSPIDIKAIRRMAGCVETWDGGIRGWAWHPGDPQTPPVLTIRQPGQSPPKIINPHDESITVSDAGPLARPRWFHLKRSDLLDRPGLVHIQGPDGTDLPGSPLAPFADEATDVATARQLGRDYAATASNGARANRATRPASHPGVQPKSCQKNLPDSPQDHSRPILRADGPMPSQPIGAGTRMRPAAVIIPVHDGGEVVLTCLTSVLDSIPPRTRVVIIDDGSSDRNLIQVLDNLARHRRITLLRHQRTLGFPASANAGIQATTGHDVILLNSDTLVPTGWIERLRTTAYSEHDIGTVTPLSNDASILSYPNKAGSNPCPDQAATNRLDRLVQRANNGAVIDIPVGVGFCLYLRRDCLDTIGSFRADLFAQGYGEENDLCLRARRLGWRNVAFTGLFVGHIGGTSFGSSAVHLRVRNSRIIERCHPGHDALIEHFLKDDPLAQARRRIDRLAWKERNRKWRHAAILITHQDGGGVEQRLILAAQAHAEAGRRPIILRPAETAGGKPAIAVRDGITDDLPNIIYAVPQELAVLVSLLRAAKPATIEAHHLATHPPAIYDLITQLNVPYTAHVHDYAWFCPRISLVGGQDRYCGEPDLSECEACVADHGHFLKEDIAVSVLRARSTTFLSAAQNVVVPSEDTAIRMRRHFPGLTTTTMPHDDDERLPPIRTAHARPMRATVCIPGAIGVHKGFNVLLACARDAAKRDLDLDFVVVGHTIDDARVIATGRVFVTGQFEPHEAVALISGYNACLGFLPSICPETWCLSLSDIWRAGLRVAAFDIGTPAERIRRTGRGFLLPLGLSAGAINNALVAAIRSTEH